MKEVTKRSRQQSHEAIIPSEIHREDFALQELGKAGFRLLANERIPQSKEVGIGNGGEIE